MQYTWIYESPLGKILLAADEEGLIGLWFEGQKYFAAGLSEKLTIGDYPLINEAKRWLDIYFGGTEPDFTPPLHLTGTAFQRSVWSKLLTIPYGKTSSYGSIAADLGKELGLPKMSPRAVGTAVGHNKISVIIPCHRVLGSNGALTGYAGGLERKTALLRLEGIEQT